MNRTSEKEIQNREFFFKNLEKLFDVSPRNVNTLIDLDRIKSEEAKKSDKEFLLDQQGPRLMKMMGNDKSYELKSIAKKCRKEMNDKRVLKEKERQQEMMRQEQERRRDFIRDVVTDNGNIEEGKNYETTEKKKKTVILEIERSVLASPEVLNMADRTKLSNRKLTGNVAALLKSAQKIVLDSEQKNYSLRTKESKLTENDNQTKTKVDLKDFHLSEKTVRRQRNKNRE